MGTAFNYQGRLASNDKWSLPHHAGQRDPARWPDDADRPITKAGEATARSVADALHHRGLCPHAVFSSPWVRAVASAEILVRAFPPAARVPIQLTSTLAVEPNLKSIARVVGDHPGPAIVTCVGHEPWLSDLASLLIWGTKGRDRLDLAKGGVIGVEARSLRAKRGHLRFLLPPDLFAPTHASDR